MIAELTPKLSWYVARASGIVALVLLTTSVVWGLLLAARVLNRHTAPGWLLDLHRYLGGVAVVFTGVHVAALVADNWLQFGWAEVLVPMRSSWRPGAVAWGVVALYLLLAVELSSLVKRRLPRPVWRAVHQLSFPLFVSTTIHGLRAGTDVRIPAYQALTVVTVTVFTVQLAVRITTARTRGVDRGRGAAVAASPTVPGGRQTA